MPIWRIVLTYAGLCAAICALRGVAPTLRDGAMRGAWMAGWLAVTIQSATGAGFDLNVALGPAAWTVAVVCGCRWAWLGAALLSIEAAHRVGTSAALAPAIGCLLGSWLAEAMVGRKHLRLRVLAHWMSFVGTFAVFVPNALAETMPPSGEPYRLLSAFLGVAGATLALAATRAFAVGGGTPEPLDPPMRLVVEGPYRHLRHPIQVAEILLVAAGLAWFPNYAVSLYAAGFTLALVGPVRMLEEAKLASRFGTIYDAWRKAVPAYWPRKHTRFNSPPALHQQTATTQKTSNG